MTDEQQILGGYCQNVFQWVGEANEERTVTSSSTALPNTDLERLWPKLLRKPRDRPFRSRVQRLFYFCETDRTHLINICTKREGIKRPR